MGRLISAVNGNHKRLSLVLNRKKLMENVLCFFFFVLFLIFSFRELVISCLGGCCNDSLSRSRKAGGSIEKMQGLESKEGKVYDTSCQAGGL